MPTPATILIVDDDQHLRLSLAAWLKDEGYGVIEAGSGETGLELARKRSADVILLDLRMPGMDGLAVLAVLRDEGLETPVIVISGHGDIEDVCQAFRLGAWDYIPKPIGNLNLLSHAVRQALERLRLRDQVRQAEERYSNLVENVPLVIFSLDKDLKLTFVNSGCRTVLGFSSQEALADPGWLMERILPEDREVMRQEFLQSLADCSFAFSRPCRLAHKSGSTVHCQIKSVPVTDCADAVPRAQLEGVILDITDRIILEKHLMREEKLKTLGAISSEVAHEIRNPLAAIGGFASRLARLCPQRKEPAIIVEECRRLEQLVDRIRDYLNPVSLHRRVFPLADAVRQGLAASAPDLEAKGIVPEIDLDSAQALVEEDPDILAQVAGNVIRAVIQAAPPGGNVRITAREAGDYSHVEVHGDQIRPVDNPETLFLPFGPSEDAIGLPFCSRLLRAMGGSLGFDQAGGRGWFILNVPKAREGRPA